MKPRIVVPPLFWLVLSVASGFGAFAGWQSQRLDKMRPPAAAPAAARTAAGTPEPARESAPSAPNTLQGPAASSAPSASASEPARQLDPAAGRLVLRCTSKGRVTYRDLNAGCPDGAAERVTVFPTEGVGKPQ